MSELELGLLILGATTAVLLIGVPISYGLAAISIVFLLAFAGPASLVAVPRVMFEEVNGFALLALPMFVLLGSVVGASRASSDLNDAAHRWLGWIPGGLVVANIVACAMFSAICGSSPATAAAIGRSGIPEMRARGVPSWLAAGSICAGGTLGILIPPSITMIVYGISTGTSIGKLFVAGVVPGLILVTVFSIYSIYPSRRHLSAATPLPPDAPVASADPSTRAAASLRVLPFLMLIVMVLVALYGGIATPSEGAAVAALLAVILVLVIYRPRPALWRVVGREAMRDSAMLLLIIAASGLFAYMLSLLYVTQSFGELMSAAGLHRWVFMSLVMIFLLIAGCFLPPVALILVVMPLIQPSLELYNFDLIWFGVVMTILMEIGLITPPVGVNLFVIQGIAPDIPLRQILLGSMPFVILMVLVIVLFAFVPGLVTWLPSLMLGG
ncbi:MAG TPA: TRAP transporter large permease [Lacipirellulaceae bacterium]|nr:TRAP transporter large permease [Lacipirellulaceae bacterium]